MSGCYYYYFIILFINYVHGTFTPSTSDYDAYGVKIAMNEHFLVLAQNGQQPPSFFIQFPPYNDTHLLSTQCSLTYPNVTDTFIYTVAIGKKQTQDQIQFFFIGELYNDQSGPFVGMATFNNSFNIVDVTSSSSCDASFSYSLNYLSNYDHQEYYILGVDPTGFLAYGFTNQFVFVFDSTNTNNFNIWNGSLTWPDSTFLPHAVDISDRFGVIAGFTYNGDNATVKYSPMIYLINFNSSNHYHPIVVDKYKPIATPDTWQDLLTNEDAGVYSAKYDMSVSIDPQGKVLVGMQFINRVFFLSVDTSNPIYLTYVNRYTNDRSLGNGKSIAWLDNGIAAIIINVYSLDYEWSQSQVFLFDMYETVFNSTATPLSIVPNSHQILPSSFSSIFLNVVSSPSSLTLMDDQGNILIFSPTQSGFYPSVRDTGSTVIFTSPFQCIPGTYKNRTGVHDCVLCPSGTKNPGNSNTYCIPCASDAFCPLGSVADISQSVLDTTYQVFPYPLSPESVIFDEILLHNMFSIGPGRCLLISPLFWALIVAGLVILIIIIMEIMHLFITHPKSQRIRKVLQTVFRHTDLIGEGEYWISGLISFSVLVLVSFAFAFSNEYLKKYPIETSSPSYFACDTTLRNAKFETNVQSLAIPFASTEQEMFDLLYNQAFTLNLDFINTLVKCDAISIQALFGLTWATIRWLTCDNTNDILTLVIPLPYQHISVQVFLADTKMMGAIRIGMTGPGYEDKNYKLKELDFHQSYSKNGYALSRTLPVAIAISKVINETKPMTGEESEFSGIYIPTFTVDMNSLFISNDQYVRSALTVTTLTIDITETPYYVKNLQEPIARQSEIIFRNLLFTVVCLEIFGLLFITYKLAFKPLYYKIIRSKLSDKYKKPVDDKQDNNTNGDLKMVQL